MSGTFDLLIIDTDETRKVVHKVEDYGIVNKHRVFYYTKKGVRSFVPVEQARFFGCEYDYYE